MAATSSESYVCERKRKNSKWISKDQETHSQLHTWSSGIVMIGEGEGGGEREREREREREMQC